MSDITVDDFLGRYTRGKVNLKDMNPYYKNTLATLIMQMPPETRSQLQITSGHRSAGHQQRIIERKSRERGHRPRVSNLGGGNYKMHGINGIVAGVSGRMENGRFVANKSHSKHGHGAAFDITGKTRKGRENVFSYLREHGGQHGIRQLGSASARRTDPFHWQITDPRLLARDGSKMQGWRNTLAPPDPIDPHAAQQDKPFIDPHVANSGAKPIPKNDLVPPSEDYSSGDTMQDPDYDWGAQSGGRSGGGGFSMPQAQQVAPVEMQSWQGSPLGGQPGFNSSQGGNALMQEAAPMNMAEAIKLNKNMMV